MVWTPETIEELKKLWEKGLTTVEIGNQLKMSKNAVVGKAHRLGLQSRPSPIRRESVLVREETSVVSKKVNVSKEAIPEQEKSSVDIQSTRVDDELTLDDALPREPEFETVPLPPEVNVHKSKKHKGVSLLDLKPDSCRWPEGDPKDPHFVFCGEKVEEGKIYCPEHCAIAYTGVFKIK